MYNNCKKNTKDGDGIINVSISVYGRIKRKCINEILLERFLVESSPLKVILSEKMMKSL